MNHKQNLKKKKKKEHKNKEEKYIPVIVWMVGRAVQPDPEPDPLAPNV